MSNVSNVPNELKITINTNIPGFQSIKYKPYMTLPSDKNDGSLQFNPLVKLNPSIIKSLPVDVQKKEFFNKGLFQSLINSHGLLRDKSLVEATKNGYVDNNIKVTLDTLFPNNSVIYINKQPYVIADIQWRKGDWKIDKKIEQLPELESTRIIDPYLYRSVVKDEIISGENELHQLPKEIIYGSNYTGSQNVASGVKIQEKLENQETQEKPNTYPSLPASQIIQPSQSIQQYNIPIKPTPKYLPLPPSQSPQPGQPGQPGQPLQQNNKFIKPMSQYPALPPSEPLQQIEQNIKPTQPPQPPQYPALPPSEQIEPIEPIEPPKSRDPIPPKKPAKVLQIADSEYNDDKETVSTYEIKLNASRKSSASLRSYFKDKDYYFMLNTIFKNMNENEKSVVDKIFKETSGVDVKPSNNLSVKAYNITTDNIRVNQNNGAGDCFFIAVSDAINYYNSNVNSNADKIIYNNYGKGNMIYTQKILRELVAYYILHLNPINFNELNDALDYKVESLNNKFAQQYDDYIKNVLNNNNNNTMTPNIFFDIVNNVYHSDDNFLIMKPTKMTEETLRKPFRVVNKSEIKNYIESSDYWANTVAIDALCEILGLNIITIESIDDKLRIPYIYSNTKPWSKYMFLYHENNHYELISFDYIFKTFRKEPTFSIKTNNVRTTIFDKLGNIYPPFNIIFLIFATNYINIRDSRDKKQFQLLTTIIQIIFNIFNEIEQNKKTDDNKKFLKLFYEYFTPSKSVFMSQIDGGAPIPFQYRPPYVSSYTKNNNSFQADPTKSNISYYITIDMDLQKGTTLSSKDLSNLKCRQRWNSVRKSYADLRGLNYVATPDYSNLPSSSSSSSSNSKPSQNNKSKTQKGGLGLQANKFNTKTNNKTKKRIYLS